MSKPLDEKKIRKIVREEIEKKMAEYKTREPLTREEFLKAIDSMDKRFESLTDSMDKRFESLTDSMDKRFESLINSMNKRFEEVFEGQMYLKVAIDSFGQRSGVRLEKTILKLLQKVLEKREIDITKIEWIELFDEKGEVFSKNYRTDIDVLIRDSLHFLMEIKYKVDNRDIFHFQKVAELYAKKYRKPNKLLLLTLEIDPKTLEMAENANIEVITGDFF